MKTSTSNLGAYVSLGGYIIISVLYVVGIFHTYNKHNKLQFASSFIPPVGIYWGAEKFWHKDETDLIDWNKRLKADVYVLYVFLASDPKKENMTEFYDSLEKYSKRIEKYPDDKYEYLKNAAKMYGRFLRASNSDLTDVLKAMHKGEIDTNYFNWSKRCKPVMDSIVSLYSINELKTSYINIDQSIKVLLSDSTSRTVDDQEFNFKAQQIKEILQADMHRINRLYQLIFNESLAIDTATYYEG